MATPKISPPSLELEAPLSPYAHEVNADGECVKECRACRWAKRTCDAPWNLKSSDFSA